MFEVPKDDLHAKSAAPLRPKRGILGWPLTRRRTWQTSPPPQLDISVLEFRYLRLEGCLTDLTSTKSCKNCPGRELFRAYNVEECWWSWTAPSCKTLSRPRLIFLLLRKRKAEPIASQVPPRRPSRRHAVAPWDQTVESHRNPTSDVHNFESHML